MGAADIENPDPDGCVADAAEEPSCWRNIASSIRNPKGAGDHVHREYCGRRSRVLYLCSAIFFIVAFSLMFPQISDEQDGIRDIEHILMACIGFPVSIVLSVSLLFAALCQGYT
jgi:hypothetical protein